MFGLFLKCCETWKECLSVCKSACGCEREWERVSVSVCVGVCVWVWERVCVSVLLSEKERERANGVDLMARSNKIHSQLPLLPDFQRSWPPTPSPSTKSLFGATVLNRRPQSRLFKSKISFVADSSTWMLLCSKVKLVASELVFLLKLCLPTDGKADAWFLSAWRC